MAEAMRGCLSLTLSGFAFASHDIGGFEVSSINATPLSFRPIILQGHPPPEIYQRWVAFGLFSSHSRLHGSSSYRVPWNYGEEAAKNMATLLEAKHSLMPYLYQLASFTLQILLAERQKLNAYAGYSIYRDRASNAESYVPRVPRGSKHPLS